MRAYDLQENDPSGFISSTLRNEWVKFDGLKVHLRKGSMHIDNDIKNATQLANLENPKRETNIYYDPAHKSTGKFSALMIESKKLAVENKYDGVYVESILNEFLPDVLKRYGYSPVNGRGGSINYWKNVS
jgi:hypothetical protein